MSLSGGAAIHEARAISSTLKRVRQNVEIGVLNAEEVLNIIELLCIPFKVMHKMFFSGCVSP